MQKKQSSWSTHEKSSQRGTSLRSFLTMFWRIHPRTHNNLAQFKMTCHDMSQKLSSNRPAWVAYQVIHRKIDCLKLMLAWSETSRLHCQLWRETTALSGVLQTSQWKKFLEGSGIATIDQRARCQTSSRSTHSGGRRSAQMVAQWSSWTLTTAKSKVRAHMQSMARATKGNHPLARSRSISKCFVSQCRH